MAQLPQTLASKNGKACFSGVSKKSAMYRYGDTDMKANFRQSCEAARCLKAPRRLGELLSNFSTDSTDSTLCRFY